MVTILIVLHLVVIGLLPDVLAAQPERRGEERAADGECR